ncbi:MAG: hypothetical protein Q4D38_02075 [Planctomycetia bacterium]|nr:hypothetical protein [Planctomycetia bacterium]
MWKRIWTDSSGVLAFEWTLILTLLVIGIIGGMCAMRDTIIVKMADVADAAVHVSHTVSATDNPYITKDYSDNPYITKDYSDDSGDTTATPSAPTTSSDEGSGS